MSKQMTADELNVHLKLSEDHLHEYYSEMAAGTPEQQKKAQLLGYWLMDYISFLRKEADFNPQKIIRYKRGSIVKAHLGYRIGSEEGGLHYGIVVDVNNLRSAQTVTIVPLTSVKATTDLERLHPSKIYLGDEIYTGLKNKLTKTLSQAQADIADVKSRLHALQAQAPAVDTPEYTAWENAERPALDAASNDINKIQLKIKNMLKQKAQLEKMKRGSIALVGQITTISKIRIYDPLYPSDVLSNIRVSNKALDQIDAKIKELYTNQQAP